MQKILVTGGAGFIGSHIANYFINNGDQVTVVDDLSMGHESNLISSDRLIFIEDDITKQGVIDSLMINQYDYIFHLAAVASVADSVERPIETHRVNFESTLALLQAIREKQKRLKRFLFTSSAAVYGDSPELPKRESMAVVPKTPYAIDKYASERYTLIYSDLYNVPTSAVRFFNIFGPNQNPKSPYSGVISILTDKLAEFKKNGNAKFVLYGDGSQTRDFVYIKDVVSAIITIIRSSDSLGQVYNVGNESTLSLLELIKEYKAITGLDLPIEYAENRAGDIQNSRASIEKLKSIGYEAKYSFKAGLNEYWQSIEK